MREVIGDRTVTEVLTVGRQEIATTSERLLQELGQPVRDGDHDRADRAAGRDSPGPGQAVLGRGEPGAAAARPADQRGARRVQQGDSASPRRGAAGRPAGRGLRARARERAQGDATRFKAVQRRTSRRPTSRAAGSTSRRCSGCSRRWGRRSSWTRDPGVLPLLPIAGLKSLLGAEAGKPGGER